MSPPCVPFFEGDNFGATFQGVTGREIKVVAYFDFGFYGPIGRTEASPKAGTFVDIDGPRKPACEPDNGSDQDGSDPGECDFVLTRVLRAFSRYFNARFQTYGRHVHYWEYISGAETAAGRRGDAVEIRDRVHPFAVIDQATVAGYNRELDSFLARLGVMSFTSTASSLPASHYREAAPFAWGFWPDVEHRAALYSSYVCSRVALRPVRRYGNPPGVGGPNGQPRTLGLWYPKDPSHPELELFASLIKDELARCGATLADEATYSHSGRAVDANDPGVEASSAVARFRGEVTTVLYVGTETRFSAAAHAADYYPEIVVAGDLSNDNNNIGQSQDAAVWRNAWGTTQQIRSDAVADTPGFRAYREGDPRGDSSAGLVAVDRYRDEFLLFEAVQAAGPRLTPASIDEGLHAIPPRPGGGPYAPAFFFDPGDHTSVKDAAEVWWDPSGRSRGGGTASSKPGCWRMAYGGRRHLAGRWPHTDDVFSDPRDPCSAFDGEITLDPV